MKIKARIDLSKTWSHIGIAFCLSILLCIVLKPIAAQIEEASQWRRTSIGWEQAHAIQASSRGHTSTTMETWHSYALPIASSTFFLTLGMWLLMDVPNHAIVRRLSEVPT
jgi:hypothetical protein